jgi:hypothetical protein
LYNGTATQKKDVSWQTYHRRSIQKIWEEELLQL